MLPIKALQGVINRHKTFAMALLSLQKLSCMWKKFQWAKLHLLIYPFPVKWRVGKQSWEPLKPLTTDNELSRILGVSLTGPMFLNSLSPPWRIQFFICRGTAKHQRVCAHGDFLHCCNLKPPPLGRACRPVSNHCINTTTVVMKKDPDRCISLCFGKKILKPHLQHPLFWELLFPPPCPDFSVSGNVFWVIWR